MSEKEAGILKRNEENDEMSGKMNKWHSWKKSPLNRMVVLLITATQLIGCGLQAEAETPVLKSELVVENHDPRLLLGNFKWLDNNHLLAITHDHVEPLPDEGRQLFQRLALWDIRSNKTTPVHRPDVGGLCLMNGNIRFFTRKIDANAKETRQYYQGTLGNLKPVDLREPMDLVSCESKEDRSFLPDWAQAIPAIDIIRLKPEHGFIWIDRDDVMQKPRGLWLYRPQANNKNQGIDISGISGNARVTGNSGFRPTFYEYKHAYFVDGSTEKNSWWIYPDGKLEAVWNRNPTDLKSPSMRTPSTRKYDSTRKYGTPSIPTNFGVIFGASSHNDDTVKDGGLFLFTPQKKLKRLVKGRITDEIEVSPDGCKVVYGNDRRDNLTSPTWLIHKLEMINLCKELQP